MKFLLSHYNAKNNNIDKVNVIYRLYTCTVGVNSLFQEYRY